MEVYVRLLDEKVNNIYRICYELNRNDIKYDIYMQLKLRKDYLRELGVIDDLTNMIRGESNNIKRKLESQIERMIGVNK